MLPLTKTEYVTGLESSRAPASLTRRSEAQPANHAIVYLSASRSTTSRAKTTRSTNREEYDVLARLRSEADAAVAGQAAELVDEQSADSRSRVQSPSTRLAKPSSSRQAEPVALPPHRRPRELRRRLIPQRHHPGQLAAERLLARATCIDVPATEAAQASEAREAAEPLAAVLDADRSAAAGRQARAGTGCGLRPDVVGTADGLAKYPYIRESRRIRPSSPCSSSTSARRAKHGGKTSTSAPSTSPTRSASAATASTCIPARGGDNYIDVSSLPFQIPLGALIPQRVENLLPACKNLGVTHITNGCYRLHPVEWNIGEGRRAPGGVRRAAARLRPRQIRNEPKLLAEFQRHIQAQGVEIAWPQLTPR